MTHASSGFESIAELREAMRKLEDFSIQQTTLCEGSSVSKTIALMRSIMTDDSAEQAVKLVMQNRHVIEKLKEGTESEKQLAKEYTQTIDRYNASCDKRIQSLLANKKGLAKFFSKHLSSRKKLPKIVLSPQKTILCHFPENHPLKRVPIPSFHHSVFIPKQSAELFKMKVIALLERSGIASHAEARASVKQSPILTSLEDLSSNCTLSQTFSLFPGQTVTVMGSSALDPKTQTITQLFPDTFHLSLESTQTGFPYPSQRAGWSLACQLLPDFPQRIDLLKEVAVLFQGKSQAITDLSPQGGLLKQAKELLSLKKQCFNKHAKELLGLHKQLALAILQRGTSSDKDRVAIEDFFEFLTALPQPYETLTQASNLIRESFIIKPHQKLFEAIIKGKGTDFGHRSPDVRYQAAKLVLDNALEAAQTEFHHLLNNVTDDDEKVKITYVSVLGMILGQAAKPIILQYLSEDLVFPPPGLSPFECQVQTACYHHLRDFLSELSSLSRPLSLADVFLLLKSQIHSDVHIFHDQEKSLISQELSAYFSTRYENLKELNESPL